MLTQKPYYKLVIGAKPYTTADMRFPCGRIRIEVSNEYPNASKVIAGLVETQWGAACEKVLDFFNNCPTGYARPRVSLTQPDDHPLHAEVARLRALKEAKNG